MKILLTGATGYIGRRLKEKLAADDDVQLRIFVRNASKVRDTVKDRVEIFEGDTFNVVSLNHALEGIDVAYYLIHSMGAKGDFEELDRLSARNFLEACIAAGVKRIVYLGGLGQKQTASKHLMSRIETGEILSGQPDKIQTIWFRAGVIIGSGSASFEIIRHLVQKLPVMITPKWLHTKTQPISVHDVLEYLSLARDVETRESLVVDIGAEELDFRGMLLGASRVMSLKRRLIPVPFLTPRLSSYWLLLMTPVPYRVARALIDGLKSETVILNENAQDYFPEVKPSSYEKAIKEALSEIEDNQVLSRWCDSSADKDCDVLGQDRIETAVLRNRKVYDFGDIKPERVFASAQSIGGENGWFHSDFLWRIRGFIDKLLGGPGLNRGRRDPEKLRIGDSLDFWKVVNIKAEKRILLATQMKVPGKAWLEFSIEGTSLAQTAHFLPQGLGGRLYWYLTTPFHAFVFRDLAKGIIKRAKTIGGGIS